MLANLHHAPARGFLRPIGRLASTQGALRTMATKSTSTDAVTKLTTPMAEKLHKAKLWQASRRAPKGASKRHGFSLKPIEARRVNIVSEQLCGEYWEARVRASKIEA